MSHPPFSHSSTFKQALKDHEVYGHDLFVAHKGLSGILTQQAIENICRLLGCRLIGTNPYDRKKNVEKHSEDSVLKELSETLEDVNNQIEVIKEESKNQFVESAYRMRTTNGDYILSSLLVTRSQLLIAIAERKQWNQK